MASLPFLPSVAAGVQNGHAMDFALIQLALDGFQSVCLYQSYYKFHLYFRFYWLIFTFHICFTGNFQTGSSQFEAALTVLC